MGVRDIKRFDLVYTPYGAGIGEKTNGKYCEYADAEVRERELLAKLDVLMAQQNWIAFVFEFVGEAAIRELKKSFDSKKQSIPARPEDKP